MYKTIIAFRDGNDIELRFWDHGEAYETLLRYTSEFDERLLYGALSYCNGEYTITTDLVDWRYGCEGELISLGSFVSMIPKDNPPELLYGRILEIDAENGMILVTVFTNETDEIWVSVEKFS